MSRSNAWSLSWWIERPVQSLLLHLGLALLAKYVPAAFALFVLLAFGTGLVDGFCHGGHRFGMYALYLAGLEVVYRMAGAPLLWELGKYLCIGLFLAGAFSGSRTGGRNPFLWYGLLLLPGIAWALWIGHPDSGFLRRQLLFSMTGPLVLVSAGWFFWNRRYSLPDLQALLQAAVWPAVTLVALLFMGHSLSDIQWDATSSHEASGGYGPNQVATVLGWFMVVLAFALLHRLPLTYNRTTDLLLFGLCAFRGLLTFSRGGMVVAAAAILGPLLLVPFFSPAFRRRFFRLAWQLTLVSLVLGGIFIGVDRLTNHYLYYRYTGKSNSEILYGNNPNRTFFSSRELVLQHELAAFAAQPWMGVGAGRGNMYRTAVFHFPHASHNELSRLLAEHGLAGLFIVFAFHMLLPLVRFFRLKTGLNKHWFLLFFLLAELTMAHSAMRLALTGAAFGLAFTLIIPERNDPVRRQ